MKLAASRQKRNTQGVFDSKLAYFLIGMVAATFLLTIFHGSLLNATMDLENVAISHINVDNALKSQMGIIPLQDIHSPPDKEDSIVHGLDCTPHGGPSSKEAVDELMYWKNIPQDSNYVSPFKRSDTRQYLTFEPDGGGWNNIRMSMETVLTLAIAMGRVLVLPPSQKMYLLGQQSFSFADFFPLQDIAREHAGLEILTMEQFLEETKGKVKDQKTQETVLPPTGRTNWDGDTPAVKNHLNPWLQKIAPNPDWDPDDCLAVFPRSNDPKDIEQIQKAFEEIKENMPDVESFINKPTPVNAKMKDRMAELISGREKLCLYTPELQESQIIHFHGKKKLGGRLLVHFYAFLFFQDFKTDLWMKRFVRDHVRYVDDIQCTAARVVEAVRQHSKEKGNEGIFDAFHIRRGDFQYKKTRVDADQILAAAVEEIPKKATVYVGTDERDKNFFKPMADHWDVLFLDDFKDLLGDISPNHYGMLDQLITSRSRTFFGCWFSTFTGYITRIRGYNSQKNKSLGYENGLLPQSYYYVLPPHKNKMHDYWPVKKLFYAREYPTSWRDIDFDID